MPTLAKPIQTTFDFSVSDQSVQAVCGNRSTVAVYGFEHCGYAKVAEAFGKKIQKIYDCSLGNENPSPDEQLMLVPSRFERLDGSKIPQVNSGRDTANQFPTQESNRLCKASLLNLVLDNYRKSNRGEEITPIIFCIDKENNNIPLTSENLLSKTKTVQVTPTHTLEMNRIVTHSELRRAEKLCNDPQLDREIRDIARRSIKFVKVKEKREEETIDTPHMTYKTKKVEFSLEEVPTPWANPDFAPQQQARKALSLPVRPYKGHDWRAQANQVAAVEQAARAQINALAAQQQPVNPVRAVVGQIRNFCTIL